MVIQFIEAEFHGETHGIVTDTADSAGSKAAVEDCEAK